MWQYSSPSGAGDTIHSYLPLRSLLSPSHQVWKWPPWKRLSSFPRHYPHNRPGIQAVPICHRGSIKGPVCTLTSPVTLQSAVRQSLPNRKAHHAAALLTATLWILTLCLKKARAFSIQGHLHSGFCLYLSATFSRHNVSRQTDHYVRAIC